MTGGVIGFPVDVLQEIPLVLRLQEVLQPAMEILARLKVEFADVLVTNE